jgi:SpoVK/Ycf46/Vps4 family AAA+-type ATPase
MPPIRHLARLFSALANKNIDAALAVASEIIDTEERKGHRTAVQLLKGAMSPNGIRTARPAEPLTGILHNGNLLETALQERTSGSVMGDAELRRELRRKLDTIVLETKNASYLAKKGIRRTSKVLFVGPPGCGKSFTAQAIANELGMKLFVVRFDGVIGAYLGQTAIHLREIFRFVAATPCVLLLDEIDALGRQRGNPSDVGELDRIVIALMQELEFLEAPGLVIGTSNLPRNLDQALWRRFDVSLQFPRPNSKELIAYSKKLVARFGLKPSPALARSLQSAKTYADAEKVVETEARRVALEQLRKK